MEVLQTSALPLGDGADGPAAGYAGTQARFRQEHAEPPCLPSVARNARKVGAGNGIRTRDFDLGKVALYH